MNHDISLGSNKNVVGPCCWGVASCRSPAVVNDDSQGKSVIDKPAVHVVVWVLLATDLLLVFNCE